jgi:hypothetical protein
MQCPFQHKTIIIIIIIIITIVGRTALFEPQPSLEDSARFAARFSLVCV